jgi:hypothetical protein
MSANTTSIKWCLCTGDPELTQAELGALECPFKLVPESTNQIPMSIAVNVRYIHSGTGEAPWDGYYALLRGAKVAVSNIYGVWFEIERQTDKWVAIRPAHLSLRLTNSPLVGIDMAKLVASGATTRATSHAASVTAKSE